MYQQWWKLIALWVTFLAIKAPVITRSVMWRAALLLTNWGQLRWINDWIIQCRSHSYHVWWKLIVLWTTVLAIKAPVITRSVMWRAGWLMTNQGQLRWINDWIIQCRSHRYHRWWQIISLWVTGLEIRAPVITRSRSSPTLIVSCSTFVETNNDLWTWHDECNMSLWWCFVPVVLFVYGQRKVRANLLVPQLQSCLSPVPGIKLSTIFLSQYNPNQALKYALSEKGHYFMVHISYVKTKPNKIEIYEYEHHILLLILIYFNLIRKVFLTTIQVPQIYYFWVNAPQWYFLLVSSGYRKNSIAQFWYFILCRCIWPGYKASIMVFPVWIYCVWIL